MPTIEVDIPDRVDMKISRLVDEGEFVDRQEAVRELLSSGLRAYQTSHDGTDGRGGLGEPEEDGLMGHDDEYVF